MKYGNYENNGDIDFIDSDDIECINDIVLDEQFVDYINNTRCKYTFKFDAINGEDHVKLCCSCPVHENENNNITPAALININLETLADMFNNACKEETVIDNYLTEYKNNLIESMDNKLIKLNTNYSVCGYIEYNSHIIGTFDNIKINNDKNIQISNIVCNYIKLINDSEVNYCFNYDDHIYKITNARINKAYEHNACDITYQNIDKQTYDSKYIKFDLNVSDNDDAYRDSRAAVLTPTSNINRYNFADDLL